MDVGGWWWWWYVVFHHDKSSDWGLWTLTPDLANQAGPAWQDNYLRLLLVCRQASPALKPLPLTSLLVV